jgi:hypothetical protein
MPIPSPLDTTTVQKVINWLASGNTYTAPEQQNIQDVITAWGMELLNLCGRANQNNLIPSESPFNQLVGFSEAYDGNGSNRMFLRNWPINSVSLLQIQTNTIQQSTSVTQAGFVIDASGKSLSLRGGSGQGTNFTTFYPYGSGSGYYFNKGIQNILVEYLAGFPAKAINNELDTIPATPGPYTVTVQVPQWMSDEGVSYAAGGALTPVLGPPAAGQYLVLGGGEYLFNAADQGKAILISYTVAGTPFDLQQMSTHVVALTYKQRNAIGQKSQSMAQGAGTISYDWSIDEKDYAVIMNYKRFTPSTGGG